MIFRPLCIDYHSRAQEIVIAAEDNTALRLLPTQHFEERNLYDELEKGDGDTNDGADQEEGRSNNANGDGLDENGEVSILFLLVISLQRYQRVISSSYFIIFVLP